MKVDYYTVLGVAATSSAADIKRAYRAMALKYHPDRNRGDELAEEKFKLVNEAYATVGDSEKRRAYDRKLQQQAASAKKRETTPPRPDDFYMPQDEVLREFYEGFYFRRQSRQARVRKGQDLRQNLKVSFRDAALGGQSQISLPFLGPCPPCRGTGVRAGSKMIPCERCRGRGLEKDRHGYFQACSACKGKGRLPTAACPRCKGAGVSWAERPYAMRIPAGVETGARLQVPGRGLKTSEAGAAGDFVVVVHVEKHPLFQRDGLDVICEVTVPLYTALAGGDVMLPTLEGMRKLKLKSPVADTSEVRLPGRGAMAESSGRRGDLVYRFHVEQPKKISTAERKLLAKLAAGDLKNFPHSAAFRQRMRRLG